MSKKRLLVPKFDFLCKHASKKKAISLCMVLLEARFTMLRIVNMLKLKWFMFLEVGKVCWTLGVEESHSICHNFLPTPRKKWFMSLEVGKVCWTLWVKESHSICHNFLHPPRRKALNAWIWKHEMFVVIPSNEELST